MNKVLIIGCSFSEGWYELVGEEEEVYRDYGWYDELPNNNQYTVYSHAGGGYLNYAHLLYQLRNSGELQQYSKCIIQETWEPRICLYHTDKYLLSREEEKIHFYLKDAQKDFIKSMALVERSSLTNAVENTYNLKLTLQLRNYLADIGSSVYLDAAVDSSAIAVDYILKDAGIPTYRFCVNLDSVSRSDNSISNNDWPHIKHMKQLDIVDEMQEIYEHHRTWPKGTKFPHRRAGHLTKTGTSLLGTLIATKLKDFL